MSESYSSSRTSPLHNQEPVDLQIDVIINQNNQNEDMNFNERQKQIQQNQSQISTGNQQNEKSKIIDDENSLLPLQIQAQKRNQLTIESAHNGLVKGQNSSSRQSLHANQALSPKTERSYSNSLLYPTSQQNLPNPQPQPSKPSHSQNTTLANIQQQQQQDSSVSQISHQARNMVSPKNNQSKFVTPKQHQDKSQFKTEQINGASDNKNTKSNQSKKSTLPSNLKRKKMELDNKMIQAQQSTNSQKKNAQNSKISKQHLTINTEILNEQEDMIKIETPITNLANGPVLSQAQRNREVIVNVAKQIQQSQDTMKQKKIKKQRQASNHSKKHANDILNQTNTTYRGSDIADEFEYQYDPGYLSNRSADNSRSPQRNTEKILKSQKLKQLDNEIQLKARFMSPQSKNGQPIINNGLENQIKSQKMQKARSPQANLNKANDRKQLLENERSPKSKLIQNDHKIITNKKQSSMKITDIAQESQSQSLRGSSQYIPSNDNHIQNYASPSPRRCDQENLSVSPRSGKATTTKLDSKPHHSSSLYQSTSKAFDRLYQSGLKKTLERNELSPTAADLQNSEQKKKLKQEDCENLYIRMKDYDQKKQQAIKMMQEAKRKEEDDEYLQTIYNKRVTSKQKQECCERLAQDAENRKTKLMKKAQEQILIQEQEMKDLFKPKINDSQKRQRNQLSQFNSQGSQQSRINHNNNQVFNDNKLTQSVESIGPQISAYGVQHHGLSLQQKLEAFKLEAHANKSQNKNRPNYNE